MSILPPETDPPPDTPTDPTAALKERLLRELTPAAEAILDDYRKFCAAPLPETVKDIKTHFAARSETLKHFEQLIKLCKWAESENPFPSRLEIDEDDGLAALIAEAQASLDQFSTED